VGKINQFRGHTSCNLASCEILYLLTYLLTRCKILFEKVTVTQFVKKLPALFHGNQMFITVFTKARHWNLSWANWIQFAKSISISRRSILMLYFNLHLALPSGLLLQASQPKPCKHLSLHHACHISCPTHHPWFNHFNNIRWRKQAVNLIIMQFSPRPVFLTFGSKYPPQHSFLKNPQSVFLYESERPSFRPIQHNWQNYRFVYFNLQAFRYEMGRQNVLDWIIASIPGILSTSDFIKNVILIC